MCVCVKGRGAEFLAGEDANDARAWLDANAQGQDDDHGWLEESTDAELEESTDAEWETTDDEVGEAGGVGEVGAAAAE